MITSVKKILIPLAILLILGFVLFMVNQISGVYLMVRSNSVLGANILLVVLSVSTLVLIGWPFVLFLKLPGPIKLPTDQDELVTYRKKLIKRLSTNTILKATGAVPRDAGELDHSLKILDKEASKIVHETATAVFLTTSVSQNGKLDALTVLATQSRMVWRIAHVYYQRPTLREIIYLYANVAGSSFLASQIEEMDVSQQVEPVITSFLRSSAGKSIPVIGPTAHIILDSLLEGSTNAFLALRVGIIAKRYCGVNQVTTKKAIKKDAFSAATKELKVIIVNSSGKIVGGLLKATRKAGLDTLKSSWEGIRNAGSRVAVNISEAGKKVNPF
ncbi:MAG: DUF697 domain-containing protein [Marinoscillum sp.]